MANHVCPWWLAYTFDNPLRPLVHRPGPLFAPYVTAGMTVADIGCGLGYFAIGLARLVGARGRVLAIDLQAKMLEKTGRRALRHGVGEIIHPSQCRTDDLGLAGPLDFALAFWVVHEIPDRAGFFGQIHGALKPQGVLFIAEPKLHVSAEEYRRELALAGRAGFAGEEEVAVKLSRAAVLRKPPG